MRYLAVIAACATALSSGAFAEQGLQPRRASADYPVHQDSKALAIGASLLPPQVVKKMFSPDINKAYVVVETGVYPAGTGSLKVAAADFALKIGDDLVHATSAATVAASLEPDRDPNAGINQRQNAGRIHGTVDAGVGYENGTDPATGRRVRGWTTGAGIGATNDPAAGVPAPDPPPKPSTRNIQADIEDRGLPEGDIVRSIAGYLYFPVPAKTRKNVELTLVYLAGDDPVALPLTRLAAPADTH